MSRMVSVIMPNYNSEQYISDAIESVLAQTYQDWEMLIVDDCSTDRSYEIIESYARKDSRIKAYRTERHCGSPGLPRNVAVGHARGRYIAFLDSDDQWMPEKLESQLRLFESADDAAVVFSFYEKISESGERYDRIVKSPSTVSYKQLLKGNVIGCLTGMYDSHKVGKIPLANIGHEDYLMWLTILKTGFCARNTNDVQALYRVRNRSFSANKLKAAQWQWQIYRRSEELGVLFSIYNFMFYTCKALRKSLK